MKSSSRILIDFDMIFDLDVGIIRTIDEKYCDESIFIKEITSLDDELLEGTLKKRTMVNPLQIVFDDESKTELMDDIYDKIMEEDYESVVDNSTLTAIYDVIESFILSNSIVYPTILCRNYYQRKIAIELFSEYKYGESFNIVLNQNDVIKISGYTDLMIKDIRSIAKFEGIDGMNVYVADLMMNVDQEILQKNGQVIPIKEYGLIWSNICSIRFIGMYPYDRNYFFDQEEFEEKDNDEDIVAGSNNKFVKSIVGEDVVAQAINDIDQYNKDDDPYNLSYEDDEDDDDIENDSEEFGFEEELEDSEEIILEEGSEVIVDDEIEFDNPDYVPTIFHEPPVDIGTVEDEYDEEDDWDPMEVLPGLIGREMKIDEFRKTIDDMVLNEKERNGLNYE
ncbi:hypothetical protein [uncultured Clostridium sp.]|uniref:hypothetical protein n=1 Tax=uncultured Clostridium sp. TaxID=59620 RepID=UPI00263A5C2C|nr:hypothetical protein [uncultured Clostridium sp.]